MEILHSKHSFVHCTESVTKHCWGLERETGPDLGVACIRNVQCFGQVMQCSLSITEKQYGFLQRTSLPSPICVSITWMCILTLFLIWKMCIYTIEGKRQLVLSMASTVCFPWATSLPHAIHLMSRCCLYFMHVGVAWSWAKEKEFGKVLDKKSPWPQLRSSLEKQCPKWQENTSWRNHWSQRYLWLTVPAAWEVTLLF